MEDRNQEKKRFQIEAIHEIIRSPQFQKYYATNVRGGLTDQDFRFEFFNEQLFNEGKWSYLSDCMVVLSPRGAKTLSIILNDAIELYERQHGRIRSKPAEDTRKIAYSAEPPRKEAAKE